MKFFHRHRQLLETVRLLFEISANTKEVICKTFAAAVRIRTTIEASTTAQLQLLHG